jgi:hypothetical protein
MRVASTTSTWPWAIVEIARGSDEGELTELIRAAYRSSRSGLVALALRGVTREIADRALDPIVDTLSDDARGVVYMDADETREDVYTAASHASVVVASTEDFRIELLKRGISAVGVEDVARGLLARPEAH